MNGRQRPVFDLYGNEALVDTGAVIPMVHLSPELLKLAWNAELVKTDVEIGGIGGQAQGSIYALSSFAVGGLTYEHLEVFVPYEPDTRYTYLLSATMFHGTKYSFDMLNDDEQSFSVEIPDNVPLHRDFRVKDLGGKLYAQIDGVLLQDAYALTRDIHNYTQERTV